MTNRRVVCVRSGHAWAAQVLQRVLNARQFGLKLIANVTYGYTAAGFSGRMPLAELADSIVQVRATHSVMTLLAKGQCCHLCRQHTKFERKGGCGSLVRALSCAGPHGLCLQLGFLARAGTGSQRWSRLVAGFQHAPCPAHTEPPGKVCRRAGRGWRASGRETLENAIRMVESHPVCARSLNYMQI